MKANELRIGNIIEARESPKVEWQQHEVLPVDISFLSQLFPHEVERYYRPIPLTPEVLERCGFEFEAIGHNDFELVGMWHESNGIVINQHLQGDYGMAYGEEGNVTELLYLHQLQNLFWCLTGNELTLKV